MRSGLSQNKRAESGSGILSSLSAPWHQTLVDMYSGENRGRYEGSFSSAVVYLSGFSGRMLEDLDSWMGDLFIFIESLIDHATGVSVDLNLLKEWISMDLSPFIDTEHVDSLGLYIPLSRARTFSFSGPVTSTIEGISDIAPIFSIFPAYLLEQFPRFKGRQLISCQAIHSITAENLPISGNIGALRGFPADQAHGGALTSAIFNLISQHMQGSSSSNTWILLKIVQTKRRTMEIFGIIKSHAVSAQRALDRKALNLDLSVPTLFHMPPLLMLLAPDMSSARNGASRLTLPTTLQSLRIEHWPRGQDVRDMMKMLAADSQDNSLLLVKMIWVHREQMTTSPTATYSPGDTLFLFIPEGNRPTGLFCGESVNFGRGRVREILGPDPIPAYSILRRQLQEPSDPTSERERSKTASSRQPSGRGRGNLAPGQGRGNSTPKLAALSSSTAGGYTLVKSKSALKADKHPATWGGQAVALPTLLGIPSMSRPKSTLTFAPPPPSAFRIPPSIRADLSNTDYPSLPSKTSGLDTPTPMQWRILDQPLSTLEPARLLAVPTITDGPPPGLAGRCISLGISDPDSFIMAYWAARTQIALLATLYPDQPRLESSHNLDFFLETKALAPKLSGAPRIIRLSPIEDATATRCAGWGATSSSQVKAVLTVLQEQYIALQHCWISTEVPLKSVATSGTVVYEPHLFRLPGSLLMKLVTGLLPVRPTAALTALDTDLGDRLAIPGPLQQAFRVLSKFLLADAINAGFPSEAVTGTVDFQYQDTIPWAQLSSDLPAPDHWAITPRVKQHFMAFKAYSCEGQSILLRALTILERAVEWSRHEKGLETRGSFLYPACSPTTADALMTTTTPVLPYPGLAELCHQEGLPLPLIESSLQEFPESWSELGSILRSWTTDPEWLPWSVWNNPPMFDLLLDVHLEDNAVEIYESMVRLTSQWCVSLNMHINSVHWSKPVQFGSTPTAEQSALTHHLFGNMDSNLADFLIVTMIERGAHWYRALLAVKEYLSRPTSKEIVRTQSPVLSHNIWALGVHSIKMINWLLGFLMKEADLLLNLLETLNPGTSLCAAETVTESDLQLGGTLPAGEYHLYTPPEPLDNWMRSVGQEEQKSGELNTAPPDNDTVPTGVLTIMSNE